MRLLCRFAGERLILLSLSTRMYSREAQVLWTKRPAVGIRFSLASVLVALRLPSFKVRDRSRHSGLDDSSSSLLVKMLAFLGSRLDWDYRLCVGLVSKSPLSKCGFETIELHLGTKF